MSEVKKLKVEYVDASTLIPYARNMNKHSEEHVSEIASSIREFGWTAPILVDNDSNVVAGHGRLLASKKLGMEQIPVIRRDHWTATQIKAMRILDNRIPRNAEIDDEMLQLELQQLNSEDFQMSLLGFGEHLDMFINPIEVNPDYAVLDGEDPDLDGMKGGVRKAIQIEFQLEHYEEASYLVKYCREQGSYVGMLLMEKLMAEKAKIEAGQV